MSLRTRFFLTFGLGGICFLLVITSLVFNRMESAMVYQLEQQFKYDAHTRIDNLNRVFNELTDRFKSTANLPMFRSMRFHQLTLNQPAFRNDVRQMELYILDIIHQYSEISQVMYVNEKGIEVFRVDESGIKTNLSDRSQDLVINKVIKLARGDFDITRDMVNDEIRGIIWWVPVYVSKNNLDGVIGFSIKYDFIREQIRWMAKSSSEEVCLSNSQGTVFLNTSDKESCVVQDDMWQVSNRLQLPGLSWAVSLAVRPDVFLVDVKKIATAVFGVIFPLVAVFAFVFSLVFSNRIIRTVHKLVDAARIMGRGDSFKLVSIERDDEFGELAKEMNRSAMLIEKNRKELQEINRDTVEKNRRNMQAIMDHSPAIIYLKDIKGFYTFVNKKFEDVFNIVTEKAIGKSDHDLFSKDIADEFVLNTEAALKAGKPVEIEEVVSIGDGFRTYVSIRFPLFDKQGSIYSVCGISTDITDIMLQEEQIRRSQKMDALGKLTGGIAHDYNNMLGIILGYSDLLINKLSDRPDLEKFAHEIQRAGNRGVKLTNKLLGFSRKKTSDAEIININNLLRDDKHMLQKTLTARINLVLDLGDDLSDVFLDVGDLEDVILNMSINAMHAMESGGQLTFQTCNKYVDDKSAQFLNMDAGSYVILNVIDTGCGIDKAVIDKIYDPFFSTKGDRGTGLGLSQVYGFVESNGGHIKVYSEPEKGTRFSIYFPSHSANQDSHIIDEDKNHNHNILKGSETILIVDDEPALVGLASEILTQYGYDVICAQSGKQALEILEEKSIDVMISDVIMPEMDGYQLAASVQQKYPSIKIQLVSGFSDDRHVNMIDDKLHKNLVHKPYNAQELLRRVRELLV